MSSIRIHDDTRAVYILWYASLMRCVYDIQIYYTEGELLWLKNGVIFFFLSLLYYYYCFRRIFSVGIYTYIICGLPTVVLLLYCIVRTVFGLLLLLLSSLSLLLYTFGYYIAVPTATVLPIPRNLLLLFFNTNRDFSFKVVKIIVKICWWPRQSCKR